MNTFILIPLKRDATGTDPKTSALTTLGLAMGAKNLRTLTRYGWVGSTNPNVFYYSSYQWCREEVDRAYVVSLHNSVSGSIKVKGKGRIKERYLSIKKSMK